MPGGAEKRLGKMVSLYCTAIGRDESVIGSGKSWSSRTQTRIYLRSGVDPFLERCGSRRG